MAIYVAQIVNSSLDLCVFYGISMLHCCTVSQQFDKHLYLTSCLNAHTHNTCMHCISPRQAVRKMTYFITSQGRQIQVLAADAMATTITVD